MTPAPATLASLSGDAPARLAISIVEEETLLLGAFQRASSCLAGAADGRLRARRRTGGPTVVAATGSVRLLLSLSSVAALVADADVPRLLNRHVRPLLRALTRLGALPRYGGRDFVSAGVSAIAWVGFAHHQGTGAALFEALVAVEAPFVLPPALDGYPLRREIPYMGKKGGALRDVTARPKSPAEVAAALDEAYRAAFGDLPPLVLPQAAVADDEPFRALAEDVIGFVGATTSAIGGDLFASEDLIDALSAALSALPPDAGEDDVRRALAEAERSTPGHVEGLRDPAALGRVAVRART